MKKNILLITLLTTFFSFSQVQIGNSMDGTGSSDLLGYAVGLSSDGNVIAIGAPLDDNSNGNNSGAVKVFINNNGTWEQIGSDIIGESGGDLSGSSVSISPDGSTVAIGATDNQGNGVRSGHVRVYRNNGGTWEKIGQDLDGESNEDKSGHSVSLSSDGNIVAIGAPFNDSMGSFSGHVRVYKNNNGTWEQIGSDISWQNPTSGFNNSGWSLDLSLDGNTIAIGAPLNDSGIDDAGEVRVYKNNNGTWEQVGSDINGEQNNDGIGGAVSLSSDGSVFATNFGTKVKVFENNNGVWSQLGNDIEGIIVDIGTPLSLSSDGSIIAVGESRNDDNGNDSGRVRIYKNNNGTWLQVGTDINGEQNNDELGYSLELSSDGTKVAIGVIGYDGTSSNLGQAKVYDLSSVLSAERNDILQFSLYPNPTKDQFNIQLKEGIELEKMSIYNQLGQLVSSSIKTTINVNSLSQGIYFVEIVTDKGKSTKKLIIE